MSGQRFLNVLVNVVLTTFYSLKTARDLDPAGDLAGEPRPSW